MGSALRLYPMIAESKGITLVIPLMRSGNGVIIPLFKPIGHSCNFISAFCVERVRRRAFLFFYCCTSSHHGSWSVFEIDFFLSYVISFTWLVEGADMRFEHDMYLLIGICDFMKHSSSEILDLHLSDAHWTPYCWECYAEIVTWNLSSGI